MCMFLSMTILVMTITTVIAVLLRRRRIGKRMPRTPYTLAATMAYLYGARFLEGLVGLSRLGTKERNKQVLMAGRDKEFGFGWTVGADGKKRVGVDEEELEGDYKVRQLAPWKR
ncbi:hypothetical protein BDD12DRAFT_801459 [Trichophaea hybrida]|nr:hypothetical protein BDD12DRAFT_801459 [Trichophaea hybrida]